MAEPGFYNDNLNRIYPLVEPVAPVVPLLPDTAIVDIGLLMGVASGFVPGTHRVWIDSVVENAGYADVTLASDAPGLVGKSLVFSCLLAGERYQTVFEESTDTPADVSATLTPESLYSETIACDPEPLWSGFIVFGDPAELSGLLPLSGSVSDAEIEPSLVQTLYQGYLSSINIANEDRTRATVPLDCPSEGLDWPYPIGQIFVAGKCLTGDVQFKAGYNTVIRQDGFDNAIVFTASKGAGAGEPCDEVPVFYHEVPPTGSNLLDGSTGCNEIIRTINGIGGQVSYLTSGTGVQITTDPELNRILVDVNMSQLFVCYESESIVSESV